MNTQFKNLFLLCTALASVSIDTYSKQNQLPKKYETKIIRADHAFEQGVQNLSKNKYQEAKNHFEIAQAQLLENIQLLEHDISEASTQFIQDALDSLKAKVAYTQAALDALHYQINKINTKEAIQAYNVFADLNNLYKAAEFKLYTFKKDALAALHKQSKVIAHHFKNAALELSMILDKAVQTVEKEEYKTEKALKKEQNKYKC
jgi:hypothetical protein